MFALPQTYKTNYFTTIAVFQTLHHKICQYINIYYQSAFLCNLQKCYRCKKR